MLLEIKKTNITRIIWANLLAVTSRKFVNVYLSGPTLSFKIIIRDSFLSSHVLLSFLPSNRAYTVYTQSAIQFFFPYSCVRRRRLIAMTKFPQNFLISLRPKNVANLLFKIPHEWGKRDQKKWWISFAACQSFMLYSSSTKKMWSSFTKKKERHLEY